MLRMLVGVMAVGAFLLVGLATSEGGDKGGKKDKKVKATITKVDAKTDTITVKIKEGGKEREVPVQLKGDVKVYDPQGKVIRIDAFRLGDNIIVIERAGTIAEVRQQATAKKKKNN